MVLLMLFFENVCLGFEDVCLMFENIFFGLGRIVVVLLLKRCVFCGLRRYVLGLRKPIFGWRR